MKLNIISKKITSIITKSLSTAIWQTKFVKFVKVTVTGWFPEYHIWHKKRFYSKLSDSLRKQPTFCDATTCFPAKWRLRNERRNSILMMCHYPDLSNDKFSANQKHLTQIWVAMCHYRMEFLHLFLRHHFAGKPVNLIMWFLCQSLFVNLA